jgi:hypothetical protein
VQKEKIGLSGGSRKTRIENPAVVAINFSWSLSGGSRKKGLKQSSGSPGLGFELLSSGRSKKNKY